MQRTHLSNIDEIQKAFLRKVLELLKTSEKEYVEALAAKKHAEQDVSETAKKIEQRLQELREEMVGKYSPRPVPRRTTRKSHEAPSSSVESVLCNRIIV